MIGNIIAETPWEIKRLGKFTSSEIDNLLTEPITRKAKEAGELSETAKTYILKKVSEIITGTRREVSGPAIEWGELYESEAAALIKEIYPSFKYMGKENPEFFPYSDFSGGSPDGLDEAAKTVHEIKCPENPVNHVRYCLLKSGEDLKEAERDYYHQVQMNMLCVAVCKGWNLSDMKAIFTTYCPIVNDPYPRIKMLTIYPDMEAIEKLQAVIPAAEQMLADIVWELSGKESKAVA